MAYSNLVAAESGCLLHGSSPEEVKAPPAWVRPVVAGLVIWAFVGPALAVICLLQWMPTSGPLVGGVSEIVSEVEEVHEKSLYDIYSTVFEGAKYVDLTHAFSPSSPVWPGFGGATFAAAKAGADIKGFIAKGEEYTYADHGFEATSFVLTTDQYGTQLDPPAHWNEFGATISDLPATMALRPLVVLDIHEKVAANASYHATVEDAKAWESAHGKIPAGSVVMVRSDWSKGWQNYTTQGLPAKYPGVSLALLKWLHLEREILFHGHEPLDTDMTVNLEGEAWLMHKNYCQAEGVANLHMVPTFGCLVTIGFARPLGGLGGYARYVAICPASSPGGMTIKEAPGAPLPEWSHPLRRVGGVKTPTEDAKPTAYCKNKAALGCTPDGRPSWEDK